MKYLQSIVILAIFLAAPVQAQEVYEWTLARLVFNDGERQTDTLTDPAISASGYMAMVEPNRIWREVEICFFATCEGEGKWGTLVGVGENLSSITVIWDDDPEPHTEMVIGFLPLILYRHSGMGSIVHIWEQI